MGNKKFHPYADCFKMIPESELSTLAEDIKLNGQVLSIIEDENGLILDGRNRYAACLLSGVEPRFETYQGDDASKLSMVRSLNQHRRHDSLVDRVAAADKLANIVNGGDRKSGNIRVSTDTLVATDVKVSAVTLDDAAKACGVSRRTVARYRSVVSQGTPELVESMNNQEVSILDASEIAKLPADQQAEQVSNKRAKKNNKRSRKNGKQPATEKVDYGYAITALGKETRFQRLISKATSLGRIEEGKFWSLLRLKKDDGERQWFYDICRELPWIKWVSSAGYVQVEAIADSEEMTLFNSITECVEQYCELVEDVKGQHDYNHHDARLFARDMRRLLAPIKHK